MRNGAKCLHVGCARCALAHMRFECRALLAIERSDDVERGRVAKRLVIQIGHQTAPSRRSRSRSNP
jgi:hypothetical protein